MKWIPADIDGQSYDLSHLHPFTFPLAMPAKGDLPALQFEIEVKFSLHCFTKEKVEDAQKGLDYGDGRETRTFDFDRYEKSKVLPEIIKTLEQRKCYLAKENNYMTVELADRNKTVHYQIYFSMAKLAPGRLTLYVRSAYVKDSPQSVQRIKPILFKAICAKTGA
ncbi:hypothetical protein [Rugamonas aquatica]|uniref:Uncharacterized protein n=1 Tax=Rugamonas aquatica TaxID=2743357 RepID=A0A6A7NAV9_9BURK|nr:hypothetical protein [Rugamonas aquatica]MQA42151.1 hypothetical protein [Rugamonas aquatica]